MRERLDVLLVEKGFFQSREKAKRAIMAGNIIVNDKLIDKSGTLIKIDENLDIRVKGEILPYVSRGGYKLEKAITNFEINFLDKLVLDVGASTGGFTDCALQNGAQHVYSVDVGSNQLDYKLRSDTRVTSLENTHIKDLELINLDNNYPDIIVMDVSFISITKVFPDLTKFFKKDTILMALIKPQFEVGKENVEKGGLVKDRTKHLKVIENIIEIGKNQGLSMEKLDFSPIKGGKGNVEYISLFKKSLMYKEWQKEEMESIIKQGEKLGGRI